MKQIAWENDTLVLLDQRRLPNEEVYLKCDTHEQVIDAIKTLAVRGAPLIGVAAAMAMVIASRNHIEKPDYVDYLTEAQKALRQSRPTAVNLMWALDEIMKVIKTNRGLSNREIFQAVQNKAFELWEEDKKLCALMGEYGESLIKDGANILTHCNTGSLAASGMGTALSVIRTAWKKGKKIHVYVDETRPLLQGARLTAWELSKDGIPFTLITDNMAGHFMKTGKINLAITGADRIAANGDSANKIGTYSVAVLANYHKIPFYITAPYSTIDTSIHSGEEIVIEERDQEEVKTLNGCFIAPQNSTAANPAFDVTPADLITAIITDKGIIRPPYTDNIRDVMLRV